MMSTWMVARGPSRKASTSLDGKALCAPSEARPMLSRSSMAGSSDKSDFTVSIFVELSQRGISCAVRRARETETRQPAICATYGELVSALLRKVGLQALLAHERDLDLLEELAAETVLEVEHLACTRGAG